MSAFKNLYSRASVPGPIVEVEGCSSTFSKLAERLFNSGGNVKCGAPYKTSGDNSVRLDDIEVDEKLAVLCTEGLDYIGDNPYLTIIVINCDNIVLGNDISQYNNLYDIRQSLRGDTLNIPEKYNHIAVTCLKHEDLYFLYVIDCDNADEVKDCFVGCGITGDKWLLVYNKREIMRCMEKKYADAYEDARAFIDKNINVHAVVCEALHPISRDILNNWSDSIKLGCNNKMIDVIKSVVRPDRYKDVPEEILSSDSVLYKFTEFDGDVYVLYYTGMRSMVMENWICEATCLSERYCI